MQTSPISRAVVIPNAQGLHARPAEMFVRLAGQFESRILLIRDDRRVEAKHIFELLTLGAGQGTRLIIEAEGPDAQDAVDALTKLVESGFPQEDVEID
jgi:phosphocarrier protein HPr